MYNGHKGKKKRIAYIEYKLIRRQKMYIYIHVLENSKFNINCIILSNYKYLSDYNNYSYI